MKLAQILTGASSVTVIVVENGLGVMSSNPRPGCLCFLKEKYESPSSPHFSSGQILCIYPTPPLRREYDTRSIC